LQHRQADVRLRDVEHFNDRVRQVRKLVQRCNNLPAWEVVGFAQAYLRGEINVGLRCTLGEETDFGFIISAARRPTDSGNDAWSGVHGQQTLMLSHNVEHMKGVKQLIPSLVRFQLFDDISFRCGERLYEFTPLVVSPGEFLGAVGNREVSVVNKRLAVAVSERRSENVETASDRVEVSASFDLESQRQRLFFNRHEGIVRGMKWLLSDGHVQVLIKPNIKALLEGWELGFGPTDRGLGVE